MNKGVAVTGMGVISCIGNNVEENYRSLVSGRPGIGKPEILKSIHTHLPVGEVKLSNAELAQFLGLKEGHSFTRAALLGAIAAGEAINNSGIKKLDGTGIISGTSVGGMDMTEHYFKEFPESEKHYRFIQAQHPGFTTGQIANYFKLKGFVTTISTACSSAANAIMLGARMIKAGQLKRVVVGGTDCLSKFTLNGFNSLMILSEATCKPFDKDRNGLNLGEGAAYLVLEAEELIEGKRVLGRVSGYANTNDAFHQTASSETGEGAFLAMKQALNKAGLVPGEIDYINSHGTATVNNDLSESRALERMFSGDNLPDFSSTKAYTGHCLAAAGGLEAVFSLLGMEKEQVFPNLNFKKPIPETGFVPVTELKQKKLNHILSNSFGFGGNCSSLIFSKNEE
ncbi:beta-ketoacyl-[acyl-carrier-protein] synthase family protein [Salegentibacter chungangensis]|uniref:Beta-ketoacyl-[acyl-carrier-protein] synthase family protein n=1 Tax=Salegentibacter chungangensis TaxID=1335724 RepID=A0ABW3NU25_9FLAO